MIYTRPPAVFTKTYVKQDLFGYPELAQWALKSPEGGAGGILDPLF